MRKRRSLVLRIWLDETGEMGGQVSDPLSEWRRPFQDKAELWALLARFLAEMPAPSSYEPLPPADDAAHFDDIEQ